MNVWDSAEVSSVKKLSSHIGLFLLALSLNQL